MQIGRLIKVTRLDNMITYSNLISETLLNLMISSSYCCSIFCLLESSPKHLIFLSRNILVSAAVKIRDFKAIVWHKSAKTVNSRLSKLDQKRDIKSPNVIIWIISQNLYKTQRLFNLWIEFSIDLLLNTKVYIKKILFRNSTASQSKKWK